MTSLIINYLNKELKIYALLEEFLVSQILIVVSNEALAKKLFPIDFNDLKLLEWPPFN